MSKKKRGKPKARPKIKASSSKKNAAKKPAKKEEKNDKEISRYEFKSGEIPIIVKIFTKADDFVPIYDVAVSSISHNTELILEKIRKEVIQEVNVGIVDIINVKDPHYIEKRFSETIELLVKKYFPDIDEQNLQFLKTYLIQKSLGLGYVEILMDDPNLEEIAINCAEEPIWVYHKKFGWLKTSIKLKDEEQIRHYSTMVGRKVGRQITILEPLLDAHLEGGNRVNATLQPISYYGNTMTIRKVSDKPFTITDLINFKTISPAGAALIWLGIQYELSMLVAGGTASGKTSMLNVLAAFFPPNQRIISIEDTRELKLPKFLHWVPMFTRQPNPEGKGGVSMLDLMVNSLRQRPDRILVGEIRRAKEAEVLFEAIHTGHSVYATVHANDAYETVERLTNPPINIPKTMLPAISMIVVQHRNRLTGGRQTFQIAEVMKDATANILMQADLKTEQMKKVNNSKAFMNTINMFTGLSANEIKKDIAEKEIVLKYLVKQKVNDVDKVGYVMAHYYTDKKWTMERIRKNKPFNI